MFRSRKFFLSLGIVVILAVLFGFFVSRQQSKLPAIFSYVPSNIDQAMINWPERNMKNNTNTFSSIPVWVQEQFQSIEVMIIGQNMEYSGQQMLFLQTKTSFNPQDFLTTLNPKTDTLYTYLRFDNWLYLFAPKDLIQKYKQPNKNQNWFFDHPDIEWFTKTIRKNSMTMITSNLWNIIWADYSKLSKNVKYIIAAIQSENKNQTKFSAYLVFNKPYTITKQSFKPVFKSYLKESTIAYVEFWDIINMLDIDVSSLMPQTTGDIETFGQVQLLNNLFKNHVAVILSKWSNVLNIWLTILSKDKNFYTQLQPLMPLLDAQLQQLKFLTGAILEQIDLWTRLSIGNPLIDGKSDSKLSYTRSCLVTAKIDVWQLLSLYKQLSNIASADSTILDNQDFFDQMEGKTLWANISIDSTKVSLEWEIK